MLVAEGIVASCISKFTKKGKEFTVVQIEQVTQAGQKYFLNIEDYERRAYPVGKKASIPVFVSAWGSKDGSRAGFNIIAMPSGNGSKGGNKGADPF